MRNITIADDDYVFSTVLQLRFEERAYRVRAAHDGHELLCQLETQQPDLLLLDLMMPGLSGIEVLRRLGEDPQLRLIPVVVMTSCSDSRTRARCLELGADGFYAKPFSPRQLAADVERRLAPQRG